MRVLVLGAGYAGVTLTRKLERALPDDVDVVVVDDTGTHLVQHEVHRVIRSPRVADHITLDLDDLFDRADVRRGRVVDVDTVANEVALADGTVLAYDVAAVCLGSETAFHDIPGVEAHAIPCKRVEHAERIRESALETIESGGHAVVGGAGLSGIQVAGELAALDDERAASADEETEGEERDAAEDAPVQVTIGAGDEDPISTGDEDETTTAPNDADESDAVDRNVDESDAVDRNVDESESVDCDADESDAVDRDADDSVDVTRADEFTVTLLEMEDAVAPNFPENFQTGVRDVLESVGVDVRTNAVVDSATDSTVELVDGDFVDYDTFVWTGGITGPDATGGERVRARADLRVGDSTFVVGDAGEVFDADGEAVPASAQSAIREARVAATNVARLVDHRRANDPGAFDPKLDRFTFDSPGWLVSVGDDAVAQVGPTVITGRAAVALKATVGAGYLSGIGDLRRATDLVNDELGLDPGDDEPTE